MRVERLSAADEQVKALEQELAQEKVLPATPIAHCRGAGRHCPRVHSISGGPQVQSQAKVVRLMEEVNELQQKESLQSEEAASAWEVVKDKVCPL